MKRDPVSSSHIASVGYDASEQVLEIEFESGGVYRYTGVARHVYQGLLSASSPGRYFHQQIRDRYDTERV
jgi:KTSC domain